MTYDNKRPAYSIVIAVHDDAQLLRTNLPVFLNQEYEGDYEVIVVDECSEDDTADVLDLLRSDYPKLYTTFLPQYQFQNRRRRLALTIGVKAAKQGWIVFADINTPPPSGQWLQELSEYTDTSTELLLGYINPKKGTVRLQAFSQVSQASTLVSITERGRVNGHQGKLLRYLRGKYDFMVVRSVKAHEALRLFDCDVRGMKYLAKRISSMFYNLFH